MCPVLHTVTTTSVCAVLKPVHWVSVLQIVGLQPMDEGGGQQGSSRGAGNGKGEGFVCCVRQEADDAWCCEGGCVRPPPLSGNSRAIIFFPLIFYSLPQQTQITAMLPLIELLHAASHTIDNKLLFLKIGGAAES